MIRILQYPLQGMCHNRSTSRMARTAMAGSKSAAKPAARMKLAAFVAWKALLIFAAAIESAHAAYVAWDWAHGIGLLW